MVSALQSLIEEGKESEKEFSDKTDKSLFIQTDDLFKEEDRFTFDTETPVIKKEPTNALQSLIQDDTLDDEQYIESSTFFQGASDVIQDIVTQPFGGLVDAAESIVNLALPEEKEIEISDWVPEAKTNVGTGGIS